MTGSLDKRGFSVRDVVYIITIVLAFAANYYTMNDRMGDAESTIVSQASRIVQLEEANKAYASLPKYVQKMQADIEKNAKTTTAIYYGLLAKGIIKPPQ